MCDRLPSLAFQKNEQKSEPCICQGEDVIQLESDGEKSDARRSLACVYILL